MKEQLAQAIARAVDAATASAGVSGVEIPAVKLDVPRNPDHGDFSTNVAMLLAKPLRRSPRDIAAEIVAELDQLAYLEGTEIAGPGFINFRLTNQAHTQILDRISQETTRFGTSQIGAGKTIQLEFVSANPTGPLHVGHGRGAAYGDALAELLRAVGFEVECEYYVNDAGRQMDILALSVWYRYQQIHDRAYDLPVNAYQGDYIRNIADSLLQHHGDRFVSDAETARQEAADDPETALDQAIARCKATLDDDLYHELSEFVVAEVLDEIKRDLDSFGIRFDSWFSERALMRSGALESVVAELERNDQIYAQGGAKWFRTTRYDDEKDRVVVRENGVPTYFASDIAYHANKYSRGFDQMINIWGADHHGYIARVRAAIAALGLDQSRLEVLLVQFAALFRNGEKVSMSTRSGEFVTLRELVDEVGRDAARFFYITRRSDQHLDFDLDLAKSESNENPVYYIQYAHARICSVFSQLEMSERATALADSTAAAPHLTSEHEKSILARLARYPEAVEAAALNREPHLLTNYLRELAAEFHTYYNSTRILVDDQQLLAARLALASGVKQVIANGLGILRIEAVTEM